MSHLLDLPERALEKVVSYSHVEYGNSMLNLTECNRFLKHFIETKPQLMKRIFLRIPINDDPDLEDKEEDKERLKACLESTRKYESVSIQYYNYDYEELEESEFNGRKMLPLKFSENIKEINFVFDANILYDRVVFDLLKCLEKLTNVEKVCVKFDWAKDNSRPEWEFYYQHEKVVCQDSLKNLRHLEMNVACSEVLEVFKNCKSIEYLKLTSSSPGMHQNFNELEALLENSKTTLKTFKYDVHKDRTRAELENVNDLMVTLLNAKLDLETVEFTCFPSSLYSTKMLIIFLKQQKNLKQLKLDGISGTIFFMRFGEVMAELDKLKTLELTMKEDYLLPDQEYLYDYEFDEEIYNETKKITEMPWNLQELEELKINCSARFETRNIPDKMVEIPSGKLKKLYVQGNFALGFGFFENISQKYGSLVELKVDNKCSKYSSNDIFWILKTLKQLKSLKFVFPKSSELDPDQFTGNLRLLHIQEVDLTLNDSVKFDNAVKFIGLMSNMSKFHFSFWQNPQNKEGYWQSHSNEFLDYITKELPNLKDLQINAGFPKIGYSDFQKMQANVQEFNKEPKLFKINEKVIRFWLDNLKKNSKASCWFEKRKLK